MRQIRQGDVLLVFVSDQQEAWATENARRLAHVSGTGGRLVLAEGEATGHAHVVEDGSARLVTDSQAQELYLLVYGSEPVGLQHEEHDELEVPPGVYRVVRQREYQEEDSWDWVRD